MTTQAPPKTSTVTVVFNVFGEQITKDYEITTDTPKTERKDGAA